MKTQYSWPHETHGQQIQNLEAACTWLGNEWIVTALFLKLKHGLTTLLHRGPRASAPNYLELAGYRKPVLPREKHC